MPYYMKRGKKEPADNAKKKKPDKQTRSFYRIIGYVIVLAVVIVLWVVRG